MPVPEYGRRAYSTVRDETSYSSYSRSYSSSRPSYLSSYSSKLSTTTLPPRPPSIYERKLTDSSNTVSSRFLSSASRSRDYGSSYRSSVSPVRATSSAYRRTLDGGSTSIAERLKAFDISEKESENSRSKFSTRPRDTSLSKYSTTSSSYSRDRSGSRELAGSPLSSSAMTLSTRSTNADSSKQGMDSAIRSRSSSSSGSTGVNREGRTVMRNGVSSRLESEVNASSESTSTTAPSASKCVSTTITTITSANSREDKNAFLSRDVDNKDSCSAASVSVTHRVDKASLVNGNKDDAVTVLIEPVKKLKSVFTASAAERDSNGNPITNDTNIAKNESESSSTAGSRRTSPTSVYIKKKSESDSNANVLEDSKSTCLSDSGRVRGGDVSAVVDQQRADSTSSASSATSSTRSKYKSAGLGKSPSQSKVIYHKIAVENKQDKEPSPETVNYTIGSANGLVSVTSSNSSKSRTMNGEGSKPESSDTTVEFNIVLPRSRKSSTIDMEPEKRFSNNSPSPELVNLAITTSKDKEKSPENIGHLNSNRRSSPGGDLATKQVVHKQSSPPPSSSSEDVTKDTVAKANPRASPPVDSSRTGHIRSPSPAQLSKINGESNHCSLKSHDSNNSSQMGPQASRLAYPYTAAPFKSPSNINGDFTSYRYSSMANGSSSSDNDSDGYSSSPNMPTTRIRPSNNERGGLAGLRNIGNTCFMNSVLQCLSNTKPLLEYVGNKENYINEINTTTSAMKGALIKAFGDVIQELWRESRVVDTSAFKDQIQKFAPRFMGYSQQDAQEFLRYLLEGLHEDVNRVKIKPKPILTDIDDALSDSQKSVESWNRYLRVVDSRIVDIFVGQLKSTLKCTTCGHCSVTFDPFWDLSLPIPSRVGSSQLSQCFELFTREEVLDGDEKPTCSKCQCRRKCTKSFSIQKFPNILVIHLKRFSPNERYRGKLSTTVDFPLTDLDLTQYSANTNRSHGCHYNLYGVANHSGSTYSGHYIAYCKHPYSNEWHCYNDSRVTQISTHSVVSSEGYVLFYEQSSQLQ